MKFLELVQSRYSVRSYSNQRVEPEKLQYIMECVRLAPSAVNLQPWHFYLVDEADQLAKICACYKREWVKTAPMCIIACTKHNEAWHRSMDNKDHGDIDISIAVEHLCLAAAEQGLGTCWVCNFDAERLQQEFSFPEGVEPCVIIPIGYASPESVATEKKRKPLDEIFSKF